MLPSTLDEAERDVQRRAGTERSAAQVGCHINTFLGDDHAEFLREQPFVVLAAQDEQGRVWASVLVGGVGFARALDERDLLLATAVRPGDRLAPSSRPPAPASGSSQSNRTPAPGYGSAGPPDAQPATSSSPSRKHSATAPNTFSGAPSSKPSSRQEAKSCPTGPRLAPPRRHWCKPPTLSSSPASTPSAVPTPRIGAAGPLCGGRRQGPPPRFPDYAGNRMFQALGNPAVEARVGLLFLDWTTGIALQVTGEAQIVWDEDQVSGYSGAERLVDVTLESVHQQTRECGPAGTSSNRGGTTRPSTERKPPLDSPGSRDPSSPTRPEPSWFSTRSRTNFSARTEPTNWDAAQRDRMGAMSRTRL